MNTVLPLISLLHSKFMQPRHWKKLEVITNKDINRASPKFCMDDLIKLELYKYADDVNELVDSAAKESKIATKLDIIIKTWEDFDFDFKDYKDTCVLGDLGEIVENVET